MDALRDLDDALSLVHLFSQVASSKLVPPTRVQACARLASEFQAYVARTRSLRKVFISIKGFYYQAEIQGVTLTWVVPHDFAQQTSADVDYRVMLSFLELYEALLTLVNFKLYHMLSLKYPPHIDVENESKGGRISAMVIEGAPTVPALKTKSLQDSARPITASIAKSPTPAQLKSLQRKLKGIESEAAPEDNAMEEPPEAAMIEEAPESDDSALLDASLPPDVLALRSLFNSCVFFCGRECPLASLEFVILSCGGTIGWEGEASPFHSEDERITHQLIDRPVSPEQLQPATREFIQPQWVYDCINARALLPTHPYRPGALCPPHLSPFRDGDEGYTPLERVRAALQEKGAVDVLSPSVDGEDDNEVDQGSDEKDSSEKEEETDSDGEDDDDDAAEYARELQAEVQGAAYSESASAKKDKVGKKTDTRANKRESEEKELAKMMMSRKKRRLYDRMQYGIQKKAAAADALAAKRAALTPGKGARGKKQRTAV